MQAIETKTNGTYVKSVRTEHVGGGCYVDVLMLDDGRCIVISDEAIGVYKNDAHFINEDGDNTPPTALVLY